jgi:hypothetical protein
LLVSLVQVGVFAFVLPAEAAALEDVGEALLAVQPGRAILEGESGAGGVGLSRRLVADQTAQVDEVLAVGSALFQAGLAPFGDEGLRGEGGLTSVPSITGPGVYNASPP